MAKSTCSKGMDLLAAMPCTTCSALFSPRIGAYRRFTYMPEYDKWAEKLCTIYLARPARRLGPPSEPGHQALWVPARDAAQILDNEGDRHFLGRAFDLL